MEEIMTTQPKSILDSIRSTSNKISYACNILILGSAVMAAYTGHAHIKVDVGLSNLTEAEAAVVGHVDTVDDASKQLPPGATGTPTVSGAKLLKEAQEFKKQHHLATNQSSPPPEKPPVPPVTK